MVTTLEDSHIGRCRAMQSPPWVVVLLADEWTRLMQVALCHMGCKVGSTKGGTEEVTFLYTLSPGACPKSYGVNVARLAGMPESILRRAGARSAELEHLFEHSNGSQNQSVDAPDPSVCKLLKNLESLLQESGTDSNTLLPLWKEATRIVTVSAC